jgi:hypothetical protein
MHLDRSCRKNTMYVSRRRARRRAPEGTYRPASSVVRLVAEKRRRQIRSNQHRCTHKVHGFPPQRITPSIVCFPSGPGEHAYYGVCFRQFIRGISLDDTYPRARWMQVWNLLVTSELFRLHLIEMLRSRGIIYPPLYQETFLCCLILSTT